LPAALSQDIGSETNRPFACVIVGGILTGTIFMLLILPAALKLFGNFSEEADINARQAAEDAGETTNVNA
jgi:cobalt-zinc-cadmium resistance protein CzcA